MKRPHVMLHLSLRRVVKQVAFGCATVLMLPALLSFRLRAAVLGSNRALEGSTQALSLVPGILGDYLRRAFLARVLAHCHPSASIGFGTVFSKTDAHISENVVIGPRCHVGLVRLDRDVLIGPGCHLPSGAQTHGTAELSAAARDQQGEPKCVHVAEGAWIGSAAIIMADVGAHAVVAAGSLVHEPVPSAVIVGGVPARVLRRRGPYGVLFSRSDAEKT